MVCCPEPHAGRCSLRHVSSRGEDPAAAGRGRSHAGSHARKSRPGLWVGKGVMHLHLLSSIVTPADLLCDLLCPASGEGSPGRL